MSYGNTLEDNICLAENRLNQIGEPRQLLAEPTMGNRAGEQPQGRQGGRLEFRPRVLDRTDKVIE